jgi:hypothetical protein
MSSAQSLCNRCAKAEAVAQGIEIPMFLFHARKREKSFTKKV